MTSCTELEMEYIPASVGMIVLSDKDRFLFYLPSRADSVGNGLRRQCRTPGSIHSRSNCETDWATKEKDRF